MYCKYCASEIDNDVIICPKCGKQVQELKGADSTPQVVINNSNSNVNTNTMPAYGNVKKKSTSIILCCIGFLGVAGLHKFYEGKPLAGLIYFFTFGLFFIGTILDLLALLAKPSTYIV